MTTADWAILVPSIVAVLTAVAALIGAYTANIKSSHVSGKADTADQVHTQLQAQISDLAARVSALNGHS